MATTETEVSVPRSVRIEDEQVYNAETGQELDLGDKKLRQLSEAFSNMRDRIDGEYRLEGNRLVATEDTSNYARFQEQKDFQAWRQEREMESLRERLDEEERRRDARWRDRPLASQVAAEQLEEVLDETQDAGERIAPLVVEVASLFVPPLLFRPLQAFDAMLAVSEMTVRFQRRILRQIGMGMAMATPYV